jgi:hypothetical protein
MDADPRQKGGLSSGGSVLKRGKAGGGMMGVREPRNEAAPRRGRRAGGSLLSLLVQLAWVMVRGAGSALRSEAWLGCLGAVRAAGLVQHL